jgi:hypothetical protein
MLEKMADMSAGSTIRDSLSLAIHTCVRASTKKVCSAKKAQTSAPVKVEVTKYLDDEVEVGVVVALGGKQLEQRLAVNVHLLGR